jgi:dUTPase
MVKFLLIGDVKAPARKQGDAGFDFFVPNDTETFRKDLVDKNSNANYRIESGKIRLHAHKDLLIPSYVKSRMDWNLLLAAENKSGVATKQKLIIGAKIIDPSYEGMIHLHVINSSDEEQTIEFGQKLVQLIPYCFDTSEHEIFSGTEEEFYKGHESTRLDGGFGSTGIK